LCHCCLCNCDLISSWDILCRDGYKWAIICVNQTHIVRSLSCNIIKVLHVGHYWRIVVNTCLVKQSLFPATWPILIKSWRGNSLPNVCHILNHRFFLSFREKADQKCIECTTVNSRNNIIFNQVVVKSFLESRKHSNLISSFITTWLEHKDFASVRLGPAGSQEK